MARIFLLPTPDPTDLPSGVGLMVDGVNWADAPNKAGFLPLPAAAEAILRQPAPAALTYPAGSVGAMIAAGVGAESYHIVDFDHDAPDVVEQGSIVVDVVLSWELDFATEEVLSYSLEGPGAADALIDTYAISVELLGVNIGATASWTLIANTAFGPVSATCAIDFGFKLYWGRGGATVLTEAQIEALASNVLATGQQLNYTFLTNVAGVGSDYLWLAYPEEFGAIPTFLDTATSLKVPFTDMGLVVVTNSLGVVRNYRLARSVVGINGAINLVTADVIVEGEATVAYVEARAASIEAEVASIETTVATKQDKVLSAGWAGSGSVVRSVDTELKELGIPITRFGVIPGSSSAQDDLIQNAIATVDDGQRLLFLPGDYCMAAQIPIQRSNIGLKFVPGARFVTDIVANNGLIVLGAEPTVFVNLNADAVEGARSVSVADAATFTKDQWIEIRSETVLTGSTNHLSKKQGELFKITGIAGTTIHLNGTLRYAYTQAATAKIGIATVRENVTIEGYRWTPAAGSIGSTAMSGLYATYAAHLTVRDFDIRDNRTLEGADITAATAIRLSNVHDALIEHGRLENIAYYGVEINGLARFVTLRDIYASRCRHTVSLVDGGTYGEPIDILHERLTSEYSTLSGFDTHDVGKDIIYRDCISRWAADDGFQNRCSMVRYIDCEAVGAINDGFASDNLGATYGSYFHCIARDCGRNGINYLGTDAKIHGGRYHNNGIISSTGPGIGLHGGYIDGAEITENDKAIHWGGTTNNPMGRLDIARVTAPKSTKQTDFIRLYAGGDGGLRTYETCSVRDCFIPGYTTNLWKWVANAVRTDFPDTSGNIIIDYAAGAAVKGMAVLVAGTVTVSTTAVRKFAGTAAAASACPIYSRINLQLVTAGGTPGNLRVSAITDGVSFVITSSSGTDTSTVLWEVKN